jgi:UDP-glucose 4-epimerase
MRISRLTLMRKVLLIGSTGFVGRHLQEALADSVTLFVTTRQHAAAATQVVYFDYAVPQSWQSIVDLAPDVIINAAGYGVVKEQTDLEATYDVNYRWPMQLVELLQAQRLKPFWLQIGTAFEYDLEEQELREESNCLPLTHYGISKYLCSNFLLSTKNQLPFLILRPFAMFGPYESASKLVPYLLVAQKNKQPIALSAGEQQRDYFYVKDLARFVAGVVLAGPTDFKGLVVNLGSGEPQSLRMLSTTLSTFIPDFEPAHWQWGKVPQRANENLVFYNASAKASSLGFQLTSPEEAFQETVLYYLTK